MAPLIVRKIEATKALFEYGPDDMPFKRLKEWSKFSFDALGTKSICTQSNNSNS
jgi:hypothetical protein